MTLESRPAQQDALATFRALVIAEEALADRVGQAANDARFVDLAVGSAADHGLALDAEAVRAAIAPDPLGLARWFGGAAGNEPVLGRRWPPKHWLPVNVAATGGRLFVDWAHFGATPLTAPFFEDSIRRALGRPLNRMVRYRTAVGDVVDDAPRHHCLRPSGFIFHMSRCGSTLVSQMLAALPRNVVISEAAAIDAAVQLSRGGRDAASGQVLHAMVAAFGRKRGGGERHYFIKLDSWHTLALPLFRRTFPTVPWVFLYRDPVEVLVSQVQRRGAQMVPEIVPPSLYGIDGAAGMASEDYCARVLRNICEATIGHDRGLTINYRELPEALWTKILPHFGVACDDGDRAIMSSAARNDAKAPHFPFAGDSETKQRQASELIRAAAERHLGGVYRHLETLGHDETMP